MSELEQAIEAARSAHLARLTGPQTCCVKLGEPDLRNGMKVCGEPVEYTPEIVDEEYSGWHHADRTVRDHHAVPASYAR